MKLNEINNTIDLKRKIVTERDIENYSELLGIQKKLVEEWVQLGEFSQLYGIYRNHVYLFEKVGIRSMDDLSKQDPESLLKILTKNQETPTINNFYIQKNKTANLINQNQIT